MKETDMKRSRLFRRTDYYDKRMACRRRMCAARLSLMITAVNIWRLWLTLHYLWLGSHTNYFRLKMLHWIQYS